MPTYGENLTRLKALLKLSDDEADGLAQRYSEGLSGISGWFLQSLRRDPLPTIRAILCWKWSRRSWSSISC
jgi:hypothetical protein